LAGQQGKEPGELMDAATAKRSRLDEPPRKLLILDTNYTLEGIRERQIEQSITCRDLDGFFAHVWSVHPFATLVTSPSWGPRFGKPDQYELAPRHTVIEAKVGRFAALRWLFPLNFLISQVDLFFRLRRLILGQGIDVIRVASPLYVGLFGLALARSCGVPLAIRVGGNHDKYFETTGRPIEPRLMRSRKVEKLVERFVFPRADLVAGANQDNLDFALANGARPERSTLFRYGNLVDRRHFEDPNARPRDDAYLGELGVKRGKFLLYVGRLEPIKQPDHVLMVLDRVRGLGHDVKAVLAGEGRMAGQLKASGAATEGAAVFPGNLTQGQLAALYPAAAVVVSPHTGRALTEAALGGAAVVAYDVDWQAELIDSGVTGLLVPHGDVDAMTAAVARLLGDPKLAADLGERLRSRALEMFDPEHLDEHERQEYRKLLERAKD
jgi:glycosyltransferase involved in cell wall biosynthesis